MEGILKAIRSLFNKEDELVPPKVQPIKSIPIQPIAAPIKPTPPVPTPVPNPVGKPNSIINAINDYFKPTPQVRTRDFVREVPAEAAKLGHSILQGVSRNIVSAAKTVGGSYTPTQPKGKVGEFLLGKEPIKTVGERSVDLSKNLEQGRYGVKLSKPLALPVAAGLVTGSTLLDIPGVNLPIGRAKDELKPIINSADELVSIVSKEFKKSAGDSVRVPIAEFFKDLAKKVNISDDILDQLDKGPIVGENFSIEKAGRHIEFILDEGFKPLKNVLEKLKTPAPEIIKKTEQVVKEVVPSVDKKGIRMKIGKPKEVIPEPNQIGLFSKGKTIAEVAEPTSKAVDEKEFDAINREANAFLKEKYSLTTPKQYAGVETKVVNQNAKAQERLIKQAEQEFGDDLINTSGKGGIKVPFSDLDYTNWKDKDILLLNRETPLRNIEDVVGKDAPKIKEFFLNPITKATQDLENFVKVTKEGLEKNVINKLGIKPNSLEDSLIMKFGEGRMTKEELMVASPTKWQQIMEADQYFRTQYDDILNKVNETITKYGYDPILKRNDYYTHYQEIGNIFQQLGNITRSEQLPAWLNGLTADFKPGKQFFKFAQPRLGGDFTESAIGAFENYLYPASRQIFYTDSIQRGRALWNTLAEAIQKNEDLPPTHLSDFMSWLNDRVNILSGKKSMMARGSEGLIGRKAYGVVNTITRQASANLVAGNVSAAMTNFIPLTQALATTEKKSFVKGLINAITNPLTEVNNFTIDGVQSSFLRRRFPYKDLSQTLWESTRDKLGWLFYTVDKLTSNAVTAGKYFEGIAKGEAPEAAMKVADDYAARLIGDRSFGQMPTVFENQGLLKIMTMFQLEVNNQLSFIFKDAAKAAGAEGNMAKSAAVLGEIALYSHLFNNLFEWSTGRRPAFDPIYIVLKGYDIWTNDEGPANEKASKMAKVVLDNLPFVSIFTGGGRIPVAAGIPTPQDIADSPLKAATKFGLTYLPPAGGYQLYKSGEGMEAYIRGYTETPGGRVKYPIEKDFDNLLRSALFGQYSSPEANKYYESGETALGETQADNFKYLYSQDPDKATEYYNRIHLQRDINNKIQSLKDTAESMREELSDPDTSVEARQKLNDMATQTKTEVIQMLNQTPETESLLDVFFGKLGELLKTIIGGGKVEASDAEGLVPLLNKPVGEFAGISGTVNTKPVGGIFPGVSTIASKASLKTGVKTKKGSSKKFTPKKLGISFPRIKTTVTKPVEIKPIVKPVIKFGSPTKSKRRVGITFGKINPAHLRRSDYL